MKKLTKVMLLVLLVSFALGLGFNNIKADAKYNRVQLDEKIQMSLRLERGATVIDYLDNNSNVNSLGIGGYSMYGVLNDDDKVLYYIADIFADEVYLTGKDNTKVVKAMIYTKDSLYFDYSKPAYLELTYYNALEDNIYTTEMKLENSELSLLTRHSVNIKLTDDDISDRLRASMNAESSFRSIELNEEKLYSKSIENFNKMEMGVLSSGTHLFSNANMTVMTYLHDTFTNTDDLWEVYISDNFNINYNNGIYSDDYITRLIPKHFFFAEGVHSYVGKEYGFAVKTTKQNATTFIADAFIFDVEVHLPFERYDEPDTSSVTVKPMFQFRYYAKQRGTMSQSDWNRQFDPNLSEVVYKHTNYNAPNYYLKDIQVKLTTSNFGLKNPGDVGYNAFQDYGDDVASTVYTYNGEGKLTGRTSYNIHTNYRVAYDYHYAANAKTNDYQLSGNTVIKHTNSFTIFDHVASHSLSDENYGVLDELNPYNRSNFLYYFESIAKSATLNKRTPQVLNNQDPLLIGTRTANNFIKAQANYNIRSIGQINESLLHVSVAADFVSDDTYYYLLFIPKGQVTVLDTMEGSYVYGTYNRYAVPINDKGTLPEYPINMQYAGETRFFTYHTLFYTGYYTIETEGDCDTILEIWDMKTRTLVTTDDNSGKNNNAKIDLYSSPTNAYKVKVRLKDPNAIGNYSLRIKPYPMNHFFSPGNYFDIFTFTQLHTVRVYIPKDGIYRFTTFGDLKTGIILFEDDGQYIGFADFDSYNSIGNNGSLDFEVTGGKYYLVTIRIYDYVQYQTIGFRYQFLYA